MDGVLVTPLRRISTPGGDVLHAMKAIDQGFLGFGEAYFSMIERDSVKGWKRHNEATLNFMAPVGLINVRVHDEAAGLYQDYRLGPDSPDNYVRLTIRPGLWVAFGGLAAPVNLLLNISTHAHDPAEADNVPLNTFAWLEAVT